MSYLVIHSFLLLTKNACFKNEWMGNSLEVQWLGLHASTAGATGSIPVRELRSRMLCGMAKKKEKRKKIEWINE